MTRHLAVASLASSLFACTDATDDVMEVSVRRLADGKAAADFESARDAYLDLLQDERSVLVHRELEAVVDLDAGVPPAPAVYVGLTQFETLEDFDSVNAELGDTSEADAFFGQFSAEVFTAVQPLFENEVLDLEGLATGGEVVEVAVRDLSTYDSFDEDAFDAAEEAYLTELLQQPGFVQEYRYVSVTDDALVVSLVVFEDQATYEAATGKVVKGKKGTAFLTDYPATTAYLTEPR